MQNTSNETATDTPTHPHSRRTSLINRGRLRQYALDAAEQRHHKFTRVSEGFYEIADAHLRAWARAYIQRLPSKGKTIK
jgi:hypothetical protein